MKKALFWVLVLALVFTVGWAYKTKDSHVVDNYSLTFDVLVVGATEVAFAIECEKMILQTATANAGEIYLGFTGVTVADNGFELDDRDQVTIDSYFPATGTGALYAIADQADQEVHYICFN